MLEIRTLLFSVMLVFSILVTGLFIGENTTSFSVGGVTAAGFSVQDGASSEEIYF